MTRQKWRRNGIAIVAIRNYVASHVITMKVEAKEGTIVYILELTELMLSTLLGTSSLHTIKRKIESDRDPTTL
jgi:hypothetical protein